MREVAALTQTGRVPGRWVEILWTMPSTKLGSVLWKVALKGRTIEITQSD